MKFKFNINDVIYYYSDRETFEENTVRVIKIREDGIYLELSSPSFTVSEKDCFATLDEAYEDAVKSLKEKHEQQQTDEMKKLADIYKVAKKTLTKKPN